ncbi:peptidase inhibitor family I36 protein [Leifsonia aquatica]|uniref:peptidase inhibitor family I36 protein n=1 Tax=Leifsonia aquatica TaxID=144185 RepID=UPI00381CDE2E
MAAALGVVVVATLSGSQPASAASSATCPAGDLCLYFNSDFGGARADLRHTDAALNNELFDDGTPGANGWKVKVGNNAASVWNRTGSWVNLYDSQDCSGPAAQLGPGEKENLTRWANAGLDLKNKVSSIKTADGLSCTVNRDQSSY